MPQVQQTPAAATGNAATQTTTQQTVTQQTPTQQVAQGPATDTIPAPVTR